MTKSACMWLGLSLALASAGVAAQTTVTTTNGGTDRTVPVFTAGTNVENSPISVSGGNVGIGTTSSPLSTLEVNGIEQIDNGYALSLSSAVDCASGGATCSTMKAVGNSGNSGYLELQGYYAGIGYNVPLALNPIGGNVGIGTGTPGPWKMLSIGNGSGATFGMGGIDGTSYNFDFDSTLGNYLQIKSEQPGAVPFAIAGSGSVGIGTTNPQYPLSVNGTIQAKEVLVNTGWSDYVFDPNYRVRSLTEVAAFIKANHHLPDIPSEAEVKKNGVSLGDMQSKLLAKIEELTLQMIQLDERNNALEKKLAQLEGRQSDKTGKDR